MIPRRGYDPTMDPRFVAAFLAGTGVLLSAPSLASGALAAFVGSPVSIFVLAVAFVTARQLKPQTPRWVVAAGAAALGSGLWLALVGPTGAGFATAVAGAGAILCGAQLALLFDPAPEEHAVPSRLDASLNLGVAADEGLKLYWELVALARNRTDLERTAREVREAAERNAEQGWLEHPERSHPVPPTLEKPTVVSRSVRGAGPLEHLTFPSEYEPHDPEIHAEYLGFERNRTSHVQPELVVEAVVLPLHGPRSILRRSGAGFLDGHPLWTNAAFTQAVWDLRRVCGWLRAQGVPSMGVYGMSLGGYTTALFSSLEDGLACAIPMIPVASLAKLTWSQLNPVQRGAAQAAGLSEELFERAWTTHCPLRHQPRVAREARLIVAAAADRIVPPEQPQALWEHWGRPAMHWFPGTHLAWVGRSGIRRRIETHLRETLVASQERPPLSRFA
jgi:hypothetical protein